MFLDPFVAKTAQPSSSSAHSKRTSTRLAKSRTSSNVFSRVDSSPDPGDLAQHPPRKASVPDLHHSDIRRMIRREISGGFEDMSQYGSIQSPVNHDRNVSDAAPRNGSISQTDPVLTAVQSSSTLNILSAGHSPVVPERQLDVEQAISLLQELKKTATPDELVALHRALLPTREVIPTQLSPLDAQPDMVPRPRMTRRRTVMPPGLATRAGLDADVLRRPEDVSVQEKLVVYQRRVSEQRAVLSPRKALTALDLADDTSSMVGTHVDLPSEFAYTHTGMYRHGTLRITNGSATPEPSVVSGASSKIPFVERVIRDGLDRTTDLSHRTEIEPEIGSCSHNDFRQSAERNNYASVEGFDHKLGQQHPSGKPVVPGEPRDAEFASMQGKQLLQSTPIPKSAIMPAKWANGPDSYPQVDHSPTHLCAGHDMDYDTVSNISEDQTAAHLDASLKGGAQAQTGATSRRSCENEDSGAGLSTRALPRPVRRHHDRNGGREGRVSESLTTAPPIDAGRKARPTATHHGDSGYGSDATSHDVNNQVSREIQHLETLRIATSPSHQHPDELDTSAVSPASAKRFSAFARFKSKAAARRKSVPSSDPSPDAGEAKDGASPLKAINHSTRETRRLQKPMPKAVLKQREAEMQRLRDNEKTFSPEPEFEPEAEITRVPHTADPYEVEDSPEKVSTPDKNMPPLQCDAPLVNDDDLRSRKLERDCRRERSKTVHGSRVKFMSDQDRAPDITRMRSKSLGRNTNRPHLSDYGLDMALCTTAGRGRHRSPERTDCHGEHASTGKQRDTPETVSQRRDAPTLQVFQHQRRYQIQPGFVMPKPGTSSARAAAPKPVKRKDQSHADLLPVEASSRMATAIPNPGTSKSGESNTVRKTEPSHSGENHNNMIVAPPVQRVENHRPYSLQAGKSTPDPRPPIQNRANTADAIREYAELQSNDAQTGPLLTDHEHPDHDFIEENSWAREVRATAVSSDATQQHAWPLAADNGCGIGITSETEESWPLKQTVVQHTIPKHDAQHSGWPGWERQAQLWRERRQNAGANLMNQMEYGDREHDQVPDPPTHSGHPESQAAPAPQHARPMYEDLRHLASPSPRPTGTALEQATAYQTLITNSHDHRPAKSDVARTESAQSTATFYTVRSGFDRPPLAKPSGPRPQSALSYCTPAEQLPPVSWNDSHERAQGHVRSESERYLPYRPEDAPSGQALPPRPMGQEEHPPRPRPDAQTQAGNLESVCDRYGGGLGFGWDRAAGFRGSAGFRANPRIGKSRVGREYGIDLSDVPVFIQRV